MSRFTPKKSLEALRNSWMTQDPDDPRLSPIGRILAQASRDPYRFKEVCRQLEPEHIGGEGG